MRNDNKSTEMTHSHILYNDTCARGTHMKGSKCGAKP